MILNSYHVDAFTDELFKGNPACVIPLENWLKDEFMLKIASENGVAETSYLIKKSCTEGYSIRWFTPDIEMYLCGHATLATAFIIARESDKPIGEILFTSASGELRVAVDNDLFTLNFPSRTAMPATLPRETYDSLSIKPLEVLKERDYLLIYKSQEQIEEIEIDRNLFDMVNMGPGGVIITAPASEPEVDFVSRFYPAEHHFGGSCNRLGPLYAYPLLECTSRQTSYDRQTNFAPWRHPLLQRLRRPRPHFRHRPTLLQRYDTFVRISP